MGNIWFDRLFNLEQQLARAGLRLIYLTDAEAASFNDLTPDERQAVIENHDRELFHPVIVWPNEPPPGKQGDETPLPVGDLLKV